MNQYLKQFIEEKFNKSGKALDLGAGEFYNVACLKHFGWKCDGVDKNQGINLEKKYIAKNSPYDLVFSNFVFHQIKNKSIFFNTIIDNLKYNGWVFLQTFDTTDKICKRGIDKKELREFFRQQGLKNISTKIFSHYDNDLGHKHWHKILQITAQK
ncbi:MAG: methyltransferase domain-containing protein [Candidatus Falkowbacteria bacterium]